MSKARELVERVARAWASIEGKIEAFDRERGGMEYDDPAYTGHYEGYMSEAGELLKRTGISDLIERQSKTIDEMREAFEKWECPRPINGKPDDTTIKECLDAGECGCAAQVCRTLTGDTK